MLINKLSFSGPSIGADRAAVSAVKRHVAAPRNSAQSHSSLLQTLNRVSLWFSKSTTTWATGGRELS